MDKEVKELTDKTMNEWAKLRERYENVSIKYGHHLHDIVRMLMDRHYDANVYGGYLSLILRRECNREITFSKEEIVSAYHDLLGKSITFLQEDRDNGTRTVTMVVEDKEQE